MTASSRTSGFTLVETLVAIAILLTVITGAFGAARLGLSNAAYSKDELVAFYLAQEGIEQVRNTRDSNTLNGRSWLTGIANSGDPCSFGRSCTVDVPNNTLTACNGSCPIVRLDAATGLYGYDSSWAATPFTRTVTLTQINQNEVQIISTITWTKGLSSRTFRARENIMNWQ